MKFRIIGILVILAIGALVYWQSTQDQFVPIEGTVIEATDEDAVSDAVVNDAEDGSDDMQAADDRPTALQITSTDHHKGAEQPEIIWIEYADYDCPFCAAMHPRLEELLTLYPDTVQWVMRHFPLPAHGESAQEKAQAAECVAELGGEDVFWEYSAQLFEDQNQLKTTEDVIELAITYGIPSIEMHDCVESGRYAAFVTEQFAIGSEAGIDGTPGGILIGPDGQAYLANGLIDLETMQRMIDDLLAL